MDTKTGIPPDATLDEFLGERQPTARERLLRRAAAVAGLLALLGLVGWWLAGRGEAAPRYATAEVQRGDLVVTVAATGNLQPTNQVEVGSELSGLVVEVAVDNNDRVKRDQVLARLDTSRLQDAVNRSRAALASAEAGVAQALATAEQARASIARLEEVHRLSGGKVPSPAELDTARAENARALAAVRTAEAAVTQARAQLSSDETNFSKALIRSPVDGVVLSRQVDPGQTVAASFNAPVLFQIAEDLARMRLDVKVDEADVGQVQAGQAATFQVDAFPGRTFPATVRRVDLGANAGTASGGSGGGSGGASSVVSYTAVLDVDNAERVLRPGMTATAGIVTTEKRDVLLVPSAALRFAPDAAEREARSGGGGVTSVLMPMPRRLARGGPSREATIGRGSRQSVHVVGPDGTPQRIAVTVGDTNGSLTEVTGEGLRAGTAVITGQLAAGAEGAAAGARAGGARGR